MFFQASCPSYGAMPYPGAASFCCIWIVWFVLAASVRACVMRRDWAISCARSRRKVQTATIHDVRLTVLRLHKLCMCHSFESVSAPASSQLCRTGQRVQAVGPASQKLLMTSASHRAALNHLALGQGMKCQWHVPCTCFGNVPTKGGASASRAPLLYSTASPFCFAAHKVDSSSAHGL